MNNKKFIFMVILFLLLYTTLTLISSYFYKARQESNWINQCFIKKENYALSIKSSKIVFTSGSNILYGIQTNILEDIFGIPVVNTAIHAGLKTDYILHRAKQILNSGDIVIVPFEYQNLMWNGDQEKTRRDYILTHDKSFFIDELSRKEQFDMLYSVTPIDLISSIIQKNKKVEEPKIGQGYNSETLNRNGDEMYKGGTKKKVLSYRPIELEKFSETKGLILIKEFSQWCKDNNIILYMTYPNTIYFDEYTKNKNLRYFEELEKYFLDNEINLLGKPLNSMYPAEYFYDTNYHMNTRGALIRTYSFINLMINEKVLQPKDNINEHLENLKKQVREYDLNATLSK